jgi:hypothetical protein
MADFSAIQRFFASSLVVLPITVIFPFAAV